MKQSGRRIAAVVLALVLAAAGMAGCRISRTRAMTDRERMACEAYTISFPEDVRGDKTLAETILSLCTAQEETEHGTVYDGTALQPYLYQCSEVTEVVSSMDRPMHLNVSYKTQDDIEASLEIDYDCDRAALGSIYPGGGCICARADGRGNVDDALPVWKLGGRNGRVSELRNTVPEFDPKPCPLWRQDHAAAG